jgi:hypothetical protein
MLNAWTTVSVTSDLTGIPRVIAAERLWRPRSEAGAVLFKPGLPTTPW